MDAEVPAEVPNEAQAIVRYAATVAEQVTAIVIATRADFQLEAQRLRDVKTAQKNLEEMRVSATGPLNQALLAINSWFREPASVLKNIEAVLKRALGEFELKERAREQQERMEAERKAMEEREELRRRAAAAAARGRTERAEELRAKADTVVAKPPDVIPPKARGMGFGVEYVYEVVDESLIPREYLMVDHSAIRAVVNGLKERAAIPGVKITSRPRVSAQGNRR